MMIWRKWHRWLGTIAGLFLLMMAGTGVIIQVDEVTGISAPPKPVPVDQALLAPIDPVTDGARAAALLKEKYPDTAVSSLWLQARETGPVAVVVFKDGTKATEINLSTGQEGPPKSTARRPLTALQKARDLVLSFHTLGIGGKAGHFFGGLIGVALCFLAVSGLWMWFRMLGERVKRKKRAWFW